MKTTILIPAAVLAALISFQSVARGEEPGNCDEALTWTPKQASSANLDVAAARCRSRLGESNQAQMACALDAALVVAEALRNHSQYPQSRDLFTDVRKAAHKAGPGYARQEVRAIQGLGAVALSDNRGPEAEARFRESLKLAETAYGSDDPVLVRGLVGIAVVNTSDGKFVDAEGSLDRGLRICKSSSAPNYADCVRVLRARGDLLLAQKRLSEAETSYSEALVMAEANLNPFDLQRGVTLMSLANVAVEMSDLEKGTGYAEKAREQFSALNDEEYLKWANDQLEWIRKTKTGPTYEDRYINGTYYRVGESNGTQVWLSATKGSDLQLMVYVVNGSGQRTTFFPDGIKVEAASERKGEVSTTPLKTYSADQYLSKVRNRDSWNMFLTAFSAGMANQPQAQTTRVSGNYYGSAYGSGGTATYSGNYYGTITQYPTAADYADAQARTRAQMDVTRNQLEAAQTEMSRNLARTQTVEAGGYYGGVVYAQKRGKQYFITVPFAGKEFEFGFVFEK